MKILFILLLFQLIISTHLAIAEDDTPTWGELNYLNDEEQVESQNYINEGKAQSVINQKCKGDLCQRTQSAYDVSDKGKRILETLAPMVPSALAAFNITGANKIDVVTGNYISKDGVIFKPQKDGNYIGKTDKGEIISSDKKSLDGDGFKKETEKKTDWCSYIPAATQTASKAYQMVQNSNLETQYNSTELASKQKASLIAVKGAQKSAASAATVEFYGYAGTSACYVTYAIAGGYTDWSVYAKIAASGLLATFYYYKSEKHLQNANDVQSIINQLPKAGDCNPHTQTACFCNEENSPTLDQVNYQKRCVPQDFQDRFTQSPFSCVTASGKADPSCSCRNSGTCIDRKLQSGLLELGLNGSSIAPVIAGIEPISKGTSGGNLAGIAKRNLAFAKKHLKKIKPINAPKIKLNQNQKKMAKTLAQLGIPPLAAAAISSKTSSPDEAKAVLSNLNMDNTNFNNSDLNKAFRDATVKYTGSSNPLSRKTGRSRPRRSFSFGKKNNKNTDNNGGVTIIDQFKRDAVSKADISKDPSKNLFDIITYRYTMSAWKRFEENIKKEIEEKPKSDN